MTHNSIVNDNTIEFVFVSGGTIQNNLTVRPGPHQPARAAPR